MLIHFVFCFLVNHCRNPKVTVKVGQSLAFDIGVLSYASPTFMHGLGKNAMVGGVASEYLFKIFFSFHWKDNKRFLEEKNIFIESIKCNIKITKI